MMTFRRILFMLLVILFASSPCFLSALELKEGRVKLILHENSGRFTAYYLEDVRKNKYSAFFLDQDPRTSVLSILIDNKVYRMGETTGFTEEMSKTAEGAKFVWKSSFIRVTEEFTFIKSGSSPLSDGFKITITVENISEQALSVGMRYLFDTYMGERDNIHFQSDSLSSIQNERSFSSTTMPRYIVSRSSKGENPGFQIMTSQSGITRIDKLILANWKRLNDNSWTYDVNTSRNFNQLPYSINDSAVALYYDAETVPKGLSRTFTILTGAFSQSGYTGVEEESAADISRLFDQAVIEPSDTAGQEVSLSVQTDLIAVRDLIKKINEQLEKGEDLTEAEFDVMEQVITELKTRKKRYEKQ